MSDSKPPSRKRYERENPTISFRIAREKKDELEELLEGLEKPKKTWFEELIDEEQDRFSKAYEKGHSEGRKVQKQKDQDQAYHEGYQEGFEEAYNLAKVEIPCEYCGDGVVLDQDDQKDRLWELIDMLINLDDYTSTPYAVTEFDWWSHDDCPKE